MAKKEPRLEIRFGKVSMMDHQGICLHGQFVENGATDAHETLPDPRRHEVDPLSAFRWARALGFFARRRADGLRDR